MMLIILKAESVKVLDHRLAYLMSVTEFFVVVRRCGSSTAGMLTIQLGCTTSIFAYRLDNRLERLKANSIQSSPWPSQAQHDWRACLTWFNNITACWTAGRVQRCSRRSWLEASNSSWLKPKSMYSWTMNHKLANSHISCRKFCVVS